MNMPFLFQNKWMAAFDMENPDLKTRNSKDVTSKIYVLKIADLRVK